MIDITICLSLAHRQDRRNQLLETYPSRLPEVEFFDAIRPCDTIVPGSWRARPSYFTTTLGHWRILEKLWLMDNWNTALILEDDALFLEYSNNLEYFLQCLDRDRPDWLGAFLGWHFQRQPLPVTKDILINRGSTQSHAYVIRRHGLWRMFDHLWCKQFDIVDWAYSHMMESDHAFFVPPSQMVTTREGFSDNGLGWKQQGT